jgi:hypothetical protein
MRRKTLLLMAVVLGLSLPAWAATVRVKGDQTPLRSAPTAESEVIARLGQGVALELVDAVRDWYKVRDPRTQREGFVLASLVELIPGEPPRDTVRPTGGLGGPAIGGRAQPGAPARKIVLPPKPGEWRDKAFVSINAGLQGAGSEFGYSFSPTEFAYAEEARLNARYPLDAGPAFDVGGGVRAWRNLAVGAAVSVFSKSSDVSVDGTVPHPLYLDRDRAVSGSFRSPRREVAVHLQATWVVPMGRRTLVSFAGGPSFFSVRQAMASGINLATVYPYDTTAVTGARTTNETKGGVGFNASGDVAYFLTRSIGVGGTVHYTRGTLTLPTVGGGARTIAGGVQIGLGLRLRLMPGPPRGPVRGPAKAPPPPPPVKR